MFNEHLLTLFKAPEYPSQQACLPDELPDIKDPDIAIYDVKEIQGARIIKEGHQHNLQFLVKWKYYGEEDNFWEPMGELLKNNKELITQFYATYPGAS